MGRQACPQYHTYLNETTDPTGIVSQPPHAHSWALVTLLLDAGADPNDAQGLYNTMFRPENRWLKLLLERGLTAAARINCRLHERRRGRRTRSA